jgi:hypothetical protein
MLIGIMVRELFKAQALPMAYGAQDGFWPGGHSGNSCCSLLAGGFKGYPYLSAAQKSLTPFSF